MNELKSNEKAAQSLP